MRIGISLEKGGIPVSARSLNRSCLISVELSLAPFIVPLILRSEYAALYTSTPSQNSLIAFGVGSGASKDQETSKGWLDNRTISEMAADG